MADDKNQEIAPAAGSPPGTPTGSAPGNPTPQQAKIDELMSAAKKPGVTDSTVPQVTQSGDREVTPITGKPPEAKPLTVDEMRTGKVDPQGRVKQQDSAGNVTGDENQIRREAPPPAAPFVATDSRTNFNRQKIAELERQALEAENFQGQRRLQARASIRAQIRELRERENRTVSGADPRAPRGSILHAEEAIAMRPEFHYRYINVLAAGKAANAQAQGYEKVPESEGGKTLGDLALFRMPLERRAERVGAQDRETKARIQRVTDDLRGEVREMAKFLRGRGVDVDEKRLGVFSDQAED